jgi:uncharacterized protein YyaL (SSP411 family)
MKLSKYELSAAEWISRAQDATPDGGVSKYYALGKGWCKESYKEVSGYIIPTLIRLFKKTREKEYLRRAIRIADWEVEVQDSDGKWDYVFDTGQVLLGLTEIYNEVRDSRHLKALIRGADWLIDIQDKNGNWSKGEFAFGKKNKIRKVFGVFGNAHNTRTAWALLKVWRITGEEKYKTAAVKNLNWVVSRQLKNGYYRDCHTYAHYLVYTASGLLESGRILNSKRFIDSAVLFADSCLKVITNSKFLEGNYNKKWKPTGKSNAALTSNAQLAILLYQIYHIKKELRYKDGADKLIDFLKKTQNLESKNLGEFGGIAGSYPLNGSYCPNQILSWATKFYLDALLISEQPSNPF